MKILRAVFSVIVAAGLILCGVLFYRNCNKGCAGFSCASGITAYAAESAGDVLQDLQRDPAFQVSDYPENAEDYSLQVIQIAESADRKLFVYVYQPSGKQVTGTSMNISTAINDNLKYVNYKLSLVSLSDTLYKYRVEDFTVKTDTVRYYDISNILRKWDASIDEKPAGDNTVQEVMNTVAQQWTACTLNDRVTYTKMDTETVLITQKHCGFIRYSNGFSLNNSSCDSHYVAFSSDHEIERLMEADVTYICRSVTCNGSLVGSGQYTYGDWSTQSVDLTADDSASNSAGMFGHTYTWKRIENIDAFTTGTDYELDSATKAALADMKWVLRFSETPYSHQTTVSTGGITPGRYTEKYTEVSEVTILRLKFETNGEVYNLGVVDNKQSGDTTPDNEPQKTLWDYIAAVWGFVKAHWQWFLIGAIVLAVGSVVVAVLKWGFKRS